MKTFLVRVPEVWYQTVRIEAETEDEAIEQVQEGNGEEVDNTLEYSSTLEPSEAHWQIAEE
jgi:hypothetical protein